MKKNIIMGLLILFTMPVFARSTEPDKKITFKIDVDTLNNPKIVGGATYICSENKCFDKQLKKIESFSPQSYLIIYKVATNKFVKAKEGTTINSILKNYKLNEITIMDGKIEISNKKYDVEHLVILR